MRGVAINLLKQIIRGQQGQALPVVMALMVLGGLVIPPALNHAATGLNSTRSIWEGVGGLYAADAGVENAIWCIKHSQPASGQLAETINDMGVSVQTENRGTFTVYLDELVPVGEHNYWVDVGHIVWDAGAGAYRYTITITWQPIPGTPLIHLAEVGVRLPAEFTYRDGSAAEFIDNLSQSEPEQTQDSYDAFMLKWRFSSPYPALSQSNPVRTEVFYVEGPESPGNNYAWAVAVRSDVGVVGEIVGTLYHITSTATNPDTGEVTGKVVAEVLEADSTYILTWRLSK